MPRFATHFLATLVLAALTLAALTLTAPVAAAQTAPEAEPPRRFTGVDPTRTRTVLAPTARTLGRGETRLGTTLYILPTVTHGVADRVDLYGAGIFAFGDGGGGVVLFGAKGALVAEDGLAVAVGSSFVIPFSSDSDVTGSFIGLPYAVATLGSNERAVSLGVTGVFGGSVDSGDFGAGEGALVSLGAETQVSNRLKLLLDAYVPIGAGDSGVSVLPGVRFFGSNVSVDLYGAVVFTGGEVGGFAPIANFSYRF